MAGFIALSWILIPLLVVAAIAWAVLAERKRQRDMQQAASDLGLAYTPKLSQADQATLDQFSLAQLGHGRAATNAIVADSGELRMVLFDYVYTTGGGKSKSTHRQSVVLASSETLDLPQFSLSPERFFHRMADLFGFKDINFDEDLEFSRRFRLKGADDAAIRGLFHPQRRAAFMNFQQVNVEGLGTSFLFYQPRKRRRVEQLRELMEQSFSVYGALKS